MVAAAASLEGLSDKFCPFLRGVVGGVTVTDRLGLRDLSGEGVFSTSTSVSDDEDDDELLTEEVVVSRISRDFGTMEGAASFFGGRPGRLAGSLATVGAPAGAGATGILVESFFGGLPRPLSGLLEAFAGLPPFGAADTEGRAPPLEEGSGRSSSLLSESDSFGITLTGTDRDLAGWAAALPREAVVFEAVAFERGVVLTLLSSKSDISDSSGSGTIILYKAELTSGCSESLSEWCRMARLPVAAPLKTPSTNSNGRLGLPKLKPEPLRVASKGSKKRPCSSSSCI